MIKEVVKFKGFEGENREATFYFNLSQPEYFDLQAKYGGFDQYFEKLEGQMKRYREKTDAESIAKITQITKEYHDFLKDIMTVAYGEKSEDGLRFIKSDTIRESFLQHLGFDALFTLLATNEFKSEEFIAGVTAGFSNQLKNAARRQQQKNGK